MPTCTPCIVEICTNARFCSLFDQFDELKAQLAREHDREVAVLSEENRRLRDALSSSSQSPQMSWSPSRSEGAQLTYESCPEPYSRSAASESIFSSPQSSSGLLHGASEKSEGGDCGIAFDRINCLSDCQVDSRASQLHSSDLFCCDSEDTSAEPPVIRRPKTDAGEAAENTSTMSQYNLLQLSNEKLAEIETGNLEQMLKDGLPAEDPTPQKPLLRSVGCGRIGPVHPDSMMAFRKVVAHNQVQTPRECETGNLTSDRVVEDEQQPDDANKLHAAPSTPKRRLVMHPGKDFSQTFSLEKLSHVAAANETRGKDIMVATLCACARPSDREGKFFQKEYDMCARHDWPSTVETGIARHANSKQLHRNQNDSIESARSQSFLKVHRTHVWSFVSSALIFYDMAVVPLSVFDGHHHGLHLPVWFSATLFWIIDLVVHGWALSHATDSYWLLPVQTSAQHRLIRHFIFRLSLVLNDCFCLSLWAAGFGETDWYTPLVYLRMLRVCLFDDSLQAAMERTTSCGSLYKLVLLRFVFCAVALNHIVACASYRITGADTAGRSFTPRGDLLSRYAWSLRWAPFTSLQAEELREIQSVKECIFATVVGLGAPAVLAMCLLAAVRGLTTPVYEATLPKFASAVLVDSPVQTVRWTTASDAIGSPEDKVLQESSSMQTSESEEIGVWDSHQLVGESVDESADDPNESLIRL